MFEYKTSKEFIKNAFTPRIAILCSTEAKKCCEKNNLDFVELLQPFSELSNDTTYKDPSGSTIIIKNLKLAFIDAYTQCPPINVAKNMLNAVVKAVPIPPLESYEVKNYKLKIPPSTPWFDTWRETFLKIQYPSDHEFTRHFLACMLVVSSLDQNPSEMINSLNQNLTTLQASNEKLPKWFNYNVLKYYIIVHDNVDGNTTIANESYLNFKKLYGPSHCFLLKINSRTTDGNNQTCSADPWSKFFKHKALSTETKPNSENSPELKRQSTLEFAEEASENKNPNYYHPLSPEADNSKLVYNNDSSRKTSIKREAYGSCLSSQDIELIRVMIYEFASTCLLPYVENQMSILHDAVSNKKGVSKSLLSVTKRWFSGSKSGSNTTSVNSLVYPTDSPELQTRRLADLYFMFGNYNLAYDEYHSAKRDYHADQAWLYFAGALEMAALSAFMSHGSSGRTYSYMEDSITTYLNVCKMPQFATRATILSHECLKSKNMYGETAHQLIRMTSEDSDLRSALLLEQASYCFMSSSMLRKYAFHMVLSGHRFSKAGQNKHSLRCYQQAYQIYKLSGWDLANDHINYTIGRQGNNLKCYEDAVESFVRLLTGESKQTLQQQATFVKEYLTILGYKQKCDETNELPDLAIPKLITKSIKVLLGPTKPLSTPGRISAVGITFTNCDNSAMESKWLKLEELIVTEVNGGPVLIFKPETTLYTIQKLQKNSPNSIINEPIQILINLQNTLQTVLSLKDIYLLWNYDNNTKVITNEILNENSDKYIKTCVIKSAVIQPNSKHELILTLIPLVTGILTITGVCYTLLGSSTDTGSIFIKGKKIINIANDSLDAYKPITIKMVPFAPCLQIEFSEIYSECLAGELQQVSVNMKNVGAVALKNVLLATCGQILTEYDLIQDITERMEVAEDSSGINPVVSVPLPNNVLDTGQSITFNIFLRAPLNKEPTSVELLVYYENVKPESIPKYRLIRHSWNLTVQQSVSIEVSSQTGRASLDEEELNIALKTTNSNTLHYSNPSDITFLNIALFSNNWKLQSDITTPKYIALKSQESAHILVKAKRQFHEKKNFSRLFLSKDLENISTSLLAASAEFARRNNLRQNATNRRAAKHKSGVLIIEWRSKIGDGPKKRIINGHSTTHIIVEQEDELLLERFMSTPFIDINSSADESSDLKDLQNRLCYHMIHPFIIRHNFNRKRTCVVSTTLVIHNLVDELLRVTIDTINAKTPLENPLETSISSASNNFLWTGKGKIIRTISPLRTLKVDLSVIVSCPGTFQLGANIDIFCTNINKEEETILQGHKMDSALTVVNVNN